MFSLDQLRIIQTTAELLDMPIPEAITHLCLSYQAGHQGTLFATAKPRKGKPKPSRPAHQAAVAQWHPLAASVWAVWQQANPTPIHRGKVFTQARQGLLMARAAEGLEEGTLQAAAKGIHLDPWYVQKGLCTWEQCFKSAENVEKFAALYLQSLKKTHATGFTVAKGTGVNALVARLTK